MLVFLDYFYTLLHTVIVLFILFGWISRRTRKAHFILLALTVISWLIIGWILGTFGYCFITDWHWDVKRELGERNLPSSFIQYGVDKLFNTTFNKQLVDLFTALGLIFGVVMAIIKKWGHVFSK